MRSMIIPSFQISIHSLRMEGDTVDNLAVGDVIDFNPLPPHGGRHQCPKPPTLSESHFNPLPPHGGRQIQRTRLPFPYYFNPLPPHGGRLHFVQNDNSRSFISSHSLRMEGDHTKMPASGFCSLISIHSLRMEGDCITHLLGVISSLFQSTPSAWRETRLFCLCRGILGISIHSLRMEGDLPEM